ncbi:MAG: zf-HC2 domain-containing protein [Myxococcaceae bacterium]|nr:zf-HC2 domain-containing protein [Myxococcaceae bacterium]
MSTPKTVGGLTCFEVLEELSDYLDGDLDAAAKAQVEAHLAGCTDCTTFGGEFGAVVKALRRRLDEDAPEHAVGKLDDVLGS